MAKIDVTQLREYEKKGLLRIQSHPTADLYIANYTEKVQFDRLWDEVTLMCRGLIFDGDGNIVARPFKKFFNLGEMDSKLLDEPFEVTEKMDGSLGILYWIGDKPYIATRGSFTSEQAIWATKFLHEKFGDDDPYYPFVRYCTYLFEIVYPENRIVVDYKGARNLYLLSIIHMEEDKEVPLVVNGVPISTSQHFPLVRRFEGISGIEQLMAEYEGHDNFEGFVVRFTESNTRLKVKLPEYVRLHKLLTGINERRIWEVLAAGQSLDPILERVPDEFYDWVKTSESKLLAKHEAIFIDSVVEFGVILTHLSENGFKDAIKNDYDGNKEFRKAFALEAVKRKEISSILFYMLDRKDPKDMIWKMIKPEATTPWKVEA